MPTGLISDWEASVPEKVVRRKLAREPRKRRLCRDNRPYHTVPFTIPGDVEVADYKPMWRVDRAYWVAGVTANIGLHDAGTHPDDGTPSGSPLRVGLRRVSADLSSDVSILDADTRIAIDINHHEDWANDNANGALELSHFNVHELAMGEHVYVSVTQIGSGRPGTDLVVSLVLVPVR